MGTDSMCLRKQYTHCARRDQQPHLTLSSHSSRHTQYPLPISNAFAVHKLQCEYDLLEKPSCQILRQPHPNQAVFDKVVAEVAACNVLHDNGQVSWRGKHLLELCRQGGIHVVGQAAPMNRTSTLQPNPMYLHDMWVNGYQTVVEHFSHNALADPRTPLPVAVEGTDVCAAAVPVGVRHGTTMHAVQHTTSATAGWLVDHSHELDSYMLLGLLVKCELHKAKCSAVEITDLDIARVVVQWLCHLDRVQLGGYRLHTTASVAARPVDLSCNMYLIVWKTN